MTGAPAVWICATCGVEHADPTGVSADRYIGWVRGDFDHLT